MDQISSICGILCALCLLIAPIALLVWIVMIIRKSEKKKKAKRFFLGALAGIIIFPIIGVATSPTTRCEHEWDVVEQSAPTCVESGTSVVHCTLCNTEKEAEAIPPTGHTFEEKTVLEASCTSTGLVEKTCSVCNMVESITTEKISHDYEVTSVKAATFEESGLEESTCSICGNITQMELPKVGTWENPCKITVEQLVSEINTNIDTAKSKYNDQWIEITGKVLDASNVAGMARFCLYGKFGDPGLRIVCWVNDEVSTPFNYQGDTVTFLGQVREITTVNATEIGDCKIISE